MSSPERTQSLAESSKIQKGMSFLDRLRSTIQKEETKVEAQVDKHKAKDKGSPIPTVQSHSPAPSRGSTAESPLFTRNNNTMNKVTDYSHYYDTCDEVTMLDGNDVFSDIPEDQAATGDLILPDHIQTPLPGIYSFGRLPGNEASSKKQHGRYVAPNLHPVKPPAVNQSKHIFNPTWFPPAGDKTPDDAHEAHEETHQSDSNYQPGYERDFLQPRKPSPFNKKRYGDFARVVPSAYPPMPGAYDYPSPFQVAYNQQHGSHFPPNFPHPHFLNAFHPPHGRKPNAGHPDMYGMLPPCMNYGPHYGSH